MHRVHCAVPLQFVAAIDRRLGRKEVGLRLGRIEVEVGCDGPLRILAFKGETRVGRALENLGRGHKRLHLVLVEANHTVLEHVT